MGSEMCIRDRVIEDKDVEHFCGVSAAIASTPDVLEIDQSSIPGAGLGVFSAAFIPERARFGPYKGEKVGWENMTDKTDTSYFWEVGTWVKKNRFRWLYSSFIVKHSHL